MSNQQTSQDQQAQEQQGQREQNGAAPQDRQGEAAQSAQSTQHGAPGDFDGLKDKKPEDLTPEELRWMADTMPGDGPGD
jgi:hypothetical protein